MPPFCHKHPNEALEHGYCCSGPLHSDGRLFCRLCELEFVQWAIQEEKRNRIASVKKEQEYKERLKICKSRETWVAQLRQAGV